MLTSLGISPGNSKRLISTCIKIHKSEMKVYVFENQWELMERTQKSKRGQGNTRDVIGPV